MTKNEILLTSGKTVFSLQDLAVLWGISEHRKVVELVKYYTRQKKLFTIRRGLYSTKQDYSDLDVAQKLIPLSYISFHTALSIHGINFQYYSEIHSCALQSRRIKVDDKVFAYHKIPENAFYNDIGLIKETTYTIVGPERAICESLLLDKNLGFDHLDTIDPHKLSEVSKIYNNKKLEKRIQKLIKNQLKNN